MMRNIVRIACLGAVLCSAPQWYGNRARAEVLSTPAAISFAPGIAAWVLPEIPRGDVVDDNQWLGQDLSLTGLPYGVDVPPVDDTPSPGGVWIPILGVILAGIAWRYFQSEHYRALYDRLYGPLNDF
jgi:hypothetical protein